tara:strand:+ start:81 stop:1160 length:1080 start_codon:yes stop_codon:yes gene_type:complete
MLKLNSNNNIILNDIRIGKYFISDYLFNSNHYQAGKRKLKIYPEKWHDEFTRLDLKTFDNSVNFILFDDVESFTNYDNDDVIRLLKLIFKNYGMLDRLKFYGNNLSILPKNTNYIPTPFFIGETSWQSKPINIRKFSKKFLFLAGYPKMIRCQILLFLQSNNILEECNWSWNVNSNPLPIDFKKYELLNIPKSLDTDIGKLHVEKMHQIINEYYDSFVSIISETYFYQETFDNFIIGKKPIFITEKTDKCFTSAQPFIVFSTSGYIKHLKELGFKTFDKWWDESYDMEMNENKRLKLLYGIIKEIHNWSFEKCEQVYTEMIPSLEHNQLLSHTMDLKHKKIRYTRDTYLRYKLKKKKLF